MIDFGDFIKSQRKNVGFPRHNKIDRITNNTTIDEAKAKVERIIASGAAKRKKKRKKVDPESKDRIENRDKD